MKTVYIYSIIVMFHIYCIEKQFHAYNVEEKYISRIHIKIILKRIIRETYQENNKKMKRNQIYVYTHFCNFFSLPFLSLRVKHTHTCIYLLKEKIFKNIFE